jgi:hypothetical protein
MGSRLMEEGISTYVREIVYKAFSYLVIIPIKEAWYFGNR